MGIEDDSVHGECPFRDDHSLGLFSCKMQSVKALLYGVLTTVKSANIFDPVHRNQCRSDTDELNHPAGSSVNSFFDGFYNGGL